LHVIVVSSYVGGLRGFCGFCLVASVIRLVSGAALGDVGSTALRQVFLCRDVTSGLPNDVIIDAHTTGHGQTVTSG